MNEQYKRVPVRPTEEMLRAAKVWQSTEYEWDGNPLDFYWGIFAAMIAAAPAQEDEKDQRITELEAERDSWERKASANGWKEEHDHAEAAEAKLKDLESEYNLLLARNNVLSQQLQRKPTMSNSKIYVTKDGQKFRPNPEFLKAMPPHERSSWALNLTSGKYKQGVDYLYDSNDHTFCCLGVKLCAAKVPLRELDGKELSDTVNHERARRLNQVFDSDPIIALRAAGGRYSASECNDSLQLSFKQIAKLIYPEAFGYELAN